MSEKKLSEAVEGMKATKRQLSFGKSRMHALRDEQGNITHNVGEIIKVAEQFCTSLYASSVRPGETTQSTNLT